jgi:hypothetical protein
MRSFRSAIPAWFSAAGRLQSHTTWDAGGSDSILARHSAASHTCNIKFELLPHASCKAREAIGTPAWSMACAPCGLFKLISCIVIGLFRSRAALEAEIVTLRH